MISLHSGLEKLLIDVCTAQHLSGNLFPDAKRIKCIQNIFSVQARDHEYCKMSDPLMFNVSELNHYKDTLQQLRAGNTTY